MAKKEIPTRPCATCYRSQVLGSVVLDVNDNIMDVTFLTDTGTIDDSFRIEKDAAGCTADSDCEDGNVCSSDVCNLGTGLCEITNNTNACDDGLSCTSGDVCSAGICAGTDDCTGVFFCDPGPNMCVNSDPPPLASASHSNTQQSNGTDGADTDTFIAAVDLKSGVDYLVIYNAGFGGAGTSDEVGARIEYGSTVIGRAEDEGSSSGTPEAVRIHQLAGFAVITGTGSDELRIKHQVSTGMSFIGGKGIVTVPLDGIIENGDYWRIVGNGDANEATSSGAFADVRNVTFDLPDAGDYLVLASMEATMAAGTDGGGAAMRLQIGGVTQKMAWAKEWETNNQSQNFTLMPGFIT